MTIRQILLLALIFPTVVLSSVLSEAALSMNARSWKSLLLKGNPVFNTGTNNNNIFDWAHNGGWDSSSKQFYFINAPAHNPTSFVIYDSKGDSFRPGPLWTTSYASHTYDAQTIYEPTNEFYYRPPLFSKFLKYKAGDTQWTVVPEISPSLAKYEYGTALAQFPEMGGIIYVLAGNVSLFTVATNTWSRLATGLSMGGMHNLAEYNPVHKVVIFGFGDNSKAMYKIDSNGIVTTLRTVPSNVAPSINGCNICCDPVSGDYLFLSDDSLRAYDVITDTWQTIRKNPFGGNSRLASIPIPEYGVIAYISVYSIGFALYKHSSPAKIEQISLLKSSGTQNLECFPNPVTTMLKIVLPENQKTSNGILSLFNMSGQKVAALNYVFHGAAISVPLYNHAPGQYIVEWNTERETKRNSITILR